MPSVMVRLIMPVGVGEAPRKGSAAARCSDMDEGCVPDRLAAELGRPRWVELGLLFERNDVESDLCARIVFSESATLPTLP